MLSADPHRRLNILTGEWILVSPHRSQRPWQGKIEDLVSKNKSSYDEKCYLCPGNERVNGNRNPDYTSTFVFNNDFSALKMDIDDSADQESELIVMKSEKGICRVICFSPRHDLTLADFNHSEITEVIKTWQSEYKELGDNPKINYVQIFENKGDIMGCSNPHPHGQIWAQESIPMEPLKEQASQLKYFQNNHKTLLSDYLKVELKKQERIVYENSDFVLLVPFWAVWPFETMIVPKRATSNILELTEKEILSFADVIKVTTAKYDKVFNVSFPYSAGIHQSPTDGLKHEEWHFHMHFYPPLLRSSTVKKFMVGYEMLAESQRDITPEYSTQLLKEL